MVFAVHFVPVLAQPSKKSTAAAPHRDGKKKLPRRESKEK
jgi:hypothetical protein